MINIINYFYGLVPNNIYQGIGMYYFDIGDIRYYLIRYNGSYDELSDIYNMHVYLINSGIYVHNIILNNDGNIITMIDGGPYVLLKAIYYTGNVDLNVINSFSNILMHNKKLYKSWNDLWINKNDYLEYQFSRLKIEYPLLRDSFNYYLGLGECAIQLCQMCKGYKFSYYLAHKRVLFNSGFFEFYNPFNLIVDLRLRDVCEYFKSYFFELSKDNIINNDDLNNFTQDVLTYLNSVSLQPEERVMFLARMLYPTYYFDLFEGIIDGYDYTKKIKKVISYVNDFEYVLKSIYLNVKCYYSNLYIDWLEM